MKMFGNAGLRAALTCRSAPVHEGLHSVVRDALAVCRSDFSRDALLVELEQKHDQELSIAFGARVTFSLRGQRESNQRERPPRLALAGLPARQVRESGPGFSSGLLPARKGVAIPGNARCAACRPQLTAAQGPRVERRAILARTRDGAKAKANSKAGARAKAGAEPPTPTVRPERRPKAEVEGLPSTAPFDFAATRLRSGRSEVRGSTENHTPRRSRRGNAAAYRVRATMARRSSRGPSAAAGGRRISPQGGLHGCKPVWRQGRMPCRQTPQPARVPRRQDACEARKRGGLLFWLLFSWPRKRKVTRAP